jgi:8-oxo-dGTP pyrophosphatase MutT (NUDIX family)
MSPQSSAAGRPASQSHMPPQHSQLAALCWRESDAGREVLLVTSSRGRWILPKGWPIDGKSNPSAARTEAWEEAGVKKGKVDRRPMGSFIATKWTVSGDEEPCRLKVYAIRVQKTVDEYPESESRDRIWVRPDVAARMVDEDGLREILAKF